MASISTDANGNRKIQFKGLGGRRQTLRLGKVSLKAAETVRGKVEDLLNHVVHALPLDGETARWLKRIDATLVNKLAAVGLCEKRGADMLGPFLDSYIKERRGKPGTKEVWRQGERSLNVFFGPRAAMRNITPGKADSYKERLSSSGLAPYTVRKRLQFATMAFRAAARRHLIGFNPFEGVTVALYKPDRSAFISRSDFDKVVAACPSHDWRTIAVLARYGGLRCPTEVLSLKLDDIDWEHNRITVTSPKTAHHPGKESRQIPLFPELHDVLLEASELAPDGAVYVVNERFRKSVNKDGNWKNANLSTTFKKIVKRAGVKVWPKLFTNLRATRDTELRETFPAHVVCEWMGHNEEIARRHYLQVTDDHFAKATQKATQHHAVSRQITAYDKNGTPKNKRGTSSQDVAKTIERMGWDSTPLYRESIF